jgi:hypothetical protein
MYRHFRSGGVCKLLVPCFSSSCLRWVEGWLKAAGQMEHLKRRALACSNVWRFRSLRLCVA